LEGPDRSGELHGSNLTAQVRNIAAVTTGGGQWRPFQEITVQVKGEILELKNTINTMVTLNSFASEVTRVAARWVRKGSSATGGSKGVAGTWKELTDKP